MRIQDDHMQINRRGQLGVGERAPDFVLRGPAGGPARFYAHAGGRPTAVVFNPDGDDPQLVESPCSTARCTAIPPSRW